MVNFQDDLFASMVQDDSHPPQSKGSGRRGDREQGREHRGETRRERKVRRASLGVPASLNTSEINRTDSTESRDSSTRKKPGVSRAKPSSTSRSSRPSSRNLDGGANRENRTHRKKEKEETPVEDYGYGEEEMGYGDTVDMGYGEVDMGYGDGAPSAPAPTRGPGRRRERRCSIADLVSGEKEEKQKPSVSRAKSFENKDFVAPMANQMEKRKKNRRGSMFGLVGKEKQPEEPEQAPKNNHRDRRRKDTLIDRVGNASKREVRGGMSYSDRILSK